jgi:predicted transcriptional regulator
MKKQFSLNEVKKLRLNSSLSQWRVASAMGKSQGWLSNIELGYVKPPRNVIVDIELTIKGLKKINTKI